MWPVLKGEKDSEYNEVVLNIDILRNMSALRKGDWKVISGKHWISYCYQSAHAKYETTDRMVYILGEVYDGKWDGWYGPSGRGKEYSYNVTAVENSMVALAFKHNNLTLPTRQTINAMRKNASVSCRTCNDDDKPCKDLFIARTPIPPKYLYNLRNVLGRHGLET